MAPCGHLTFAGIPRDISKNRGPNTKHCSIIQGTSHDVSGGHKGRAPNSSRVRDLAPHCLEGCCCAQLLSLLNIRHRSRLRLVEVDQLAPQGEVLDAPIVKGHLHTRQDFLHVVPAAGAPKLTQSLSAPIPIIFFGNLRACVILQLETEHYPSLAMQQSRSVARICFCFCGSCSKWLDASRMTSCMTQT